MSTEFVLGDDFARVASSADEGEWFPQRHLDLAGCRLVRDDADLATLGDVPVHAGTDADLDPPCRV